jgi:hypothetical protein
MKDESEKDNKNQAHTHQMELRSKFNGEVKDLKKKRAP